MSGRIQVYVQRYYRHRGARRLQALDLGDILGVSGTLFKTNMGELTVNASATVCCPLRCVRCRKIPRPGRSGTEIPPALLDLITADTARETFVRRSKIIQAIREFKSATALEVETPMMHPIPGGAAVAFVTQLQCARL